MMRLKIKDLYKFDFITTDEDGIFSKFAEVDGDNNPIYPLVSDFITQTNAVTLDVDYYIGNSGEKYLSPLGIHLWEQSLIVNGFSMADYLSGNMSDNDIESCIASFNGMFVVIAYNRFGDKWKHLYDAITTSYKPLENYSMKEKRTPNITKTENGTFNKEVENENGVYGFNSPDSNPSDNNTGKEKNTITNHTESETGTEELERAGNIGVTTSQQMLESEFEVRKYDFYQHIFKDIDSLLCLKIY